MLTGPSRGPAKQLVVPPFTASSWASRDPILRGPQLLDHRDLKTPVRTVPYINAYLVDGPNVLVQKRMKPLSQQLPEVVAGSKAVDWGFLTVEPEQYEGVAADPVAKVPASIQGWR